jgi:hypothetical protein
MKRKEGKKRMERGTEKKRKDKGRKIEIRGYLG